MPEIDQTVTARITDDQKRAFDSLPDDLKTRLNTNPLSTTEILELKELDERLAKFGERMSTVMCPW